jgi:hypothetical protein
MQDRFLRNAWISGSIASLASALVLAGRGRLETPTAAAPINAVSHWIHGDRAYARNRSTLRHTALGFAIHHASAVFWGLLYEAVLRRIARSRRTGGAADPKRPLQAGMPALGDRPAGVPTAGDRLAGAALVTGVAALTDLRLVPARLTPGFEHRLRPASVALVYLGFAAGLVIGATVCRRA